MTLGQCDACGLVQLIDPVPASALMPRQPGVTYLEPEGHLDAVAELIATLPGIGSRSVIGGISYKEDSLLERLRARGCRRTWRLDPQRELGIDDPRAGIETIQARVTAEWGHRRTAAAGRADVVIARHILEHAHQTSEFLEGLKALIHPGGYLVLEVPDSQRAFDTADASALWEEHVVYCTPATFRQQFAEGGLSLVRLDSFPYRLEHCLVGIGQPHAQESARTLSDAVRMEERGRASGYAAALLKTRKAYHRVLSEYRKQYGGVIAMLGAGHRACAFLNLFELKDEIAFVVDDHPDKQGRYLPGSRRPVYPSSALLERSASLCLLSVNPDSEPKLRQRHQAFVERGGAFASMYADSPSALRLWEEPVSVG